MRLAAAGLCALWLIGCVDGTTPKCTDVDSGCFPTDAPASSQGDAADASSDVGSNDGAPDAIADAAVD
jgi:hypothetical protein